MWNHHWHVEPPLTMHHYRISNTSDTWNHHWLYPLQAFPSGGGHGGTPPIPWLFWSLPHYNRCSPWGTTPSPFKNELPSSRKWFLEKNKKLKTVINTCVSLVKQHWKKMAEIPQKQDFLTWSIQNFIRKVKLFVRKYYII